MRSRAGTAVGRLRDELDRSLFPPAPADAVRFGGWEGVAVLVSFLALAAALQLLRADPSQSFHALFAEDGQVFLGVALSHGFLDAVTTPYPEYLVLFPRLIGEVGSAVPLRYAPEAMNSAAVLLVGLSCLAVWFASAGLIHSAYLRALLVLVTLLTPTGGLETVVTATNVAWYTSFAAFWLLLWRPRTTWGACLGALLVFGSVLSSPAAFFFIPLAILRAVAIRDRRDALVVGAFALALAAQLPVTLLHEHPVDPVWTGKILTAFLQRVLDGAVLGPELGGEAWMQWGWPFLIAISLAVAAYLVWLAWSAASGRLFTAIALATAVVMFLASCYGRALGDVMVWASNSYTGNGGRYAMIPALLLISAVLVLVDARNRSSQQRLWLGLATGVVLLIAVVTSFGGDAGRAMPSWSGSLQNRAAWCRQTGAAEARIFIAPEGWSMTVSCERLESEYETAPAG